MDVNGRSESQGFGQPRASGPENAGGMGFIDHQPCAIPLFKGHELPQRRHIPVHGKDAIGDDEDPASRRLLLQEVLQALQIVVGITIIPGLGQALAVYDTGVVQLIRQDHIAFAHEASNHPHIGHIPGVKQDGPRRALESGHGLFHLVVQGQGANDEAGGGAARPPTGRRLLSRGHQTGIGGQPQVIVGGQIEINLPLHLDAAPGQIGLHHLQPAAQMSALQFVQLLGQDSIKGAHRNKNQKSRIFQGRGGLRFRPARRLAPVLASGSSGNIHPQAQRHPEAAEPPAGSSWPVRALKADTRAWVQQVRHHRL